MSPRGEINLHLHERQGDALDTLATEVLYGGAAGGGKSHLMRVAAILWCAAIPGLQVYLFRRIYDDLIKNHMEGPKGFQAMLAPWVLAGFVKIVDDEVRFWNGSKIYLCHCEHEKHIYKYQGAEIHVLLIDELTHFSESMYRFLRNRVRMVGVKVPSEWAGKFPRILCGANPGNIGHLFVKSTFVDDAEPMALRQMPANEGGMVRQYIPAKLWDNPSMVEDDPGYEARLSGLGSQALVAAMRDGDWNVVDGAFFDCWQTERHVVRPFTIPPTWVRIRSGDWGYAKPFSVGWWAVVADPYVTETGLILPRGCMVRYREWYGKKAANVGLRLDAEEVAAGIKERENGEKIDAAVLDPSAFAQNGGPSIAERMYTSHKVIWRPADNTRVGARGAMSGWDAMRGRLKGNEEDNPMMVCFSSCMDSIRTIPVLQHDATRAEDLDTDGEDHAADEWRYASNSRPWVRKPVTKEPGKTIQNMTLNDLWKTRRPAERRI
jgi:hypothetical protein